MFRPQYNNFPFPWFPLGRQNNFTFSKTIYNSVELFATRVIWIWWSFLSSPIFQIARAFPRLQILEIEQAEEPQIAYDSLYSLCFFKDLKHLSIKGWKQFNCAGRGNQPHSLQIKRKFRFLLPYYPPLRSVSQFRPIETPQHGNNSRLFGKYSFLLEGDEEFERN